VECHGLLEVVASTTDGWIQRPTTTDIWKQVQQREMSTECKGAKAEEQVIDWLEDFNCVAEEMG